MILSDRDLKIELESGRVVVEPLGTNAIQPSSIDLRIGRHFRIFANTRYPYIDVRKPMEGLTELVEVTGDEPFILHPGEFVLGTTLERVAIPDDLVGRLEGKSSLGRLGLLIHSTAGFVDAGFSGNLTLELSNVANLPITLYPGMKIGQISLFRMSSPAENPYGSNRLGSKYLDQVGPTPSRYWENFQTPTEDRPESDQAANDQLGGPSSK
jgi:dCTP deaminase